MGRSKAVTPRLFVGDDVDLEHVRPSDPASAAQAIEDGQTVLVPDWLTAEAVLVLLGADQEHISRTRRVLQE